MSKPKSTIIFLSGQGRFVEEFMRTRPKEFSSTGVLLSYYDIRNEKTGKGRNNRRLRALIGEEPDECEDS